MPDTTYGLPYPLETDLVNQGAADIQDLAETVDAKVLAGRLDWGPAGAPDVSLYRNGVDQLRTDDMLIIQRPAAGDVELYLGVAGEGAPRWQVNASGTITWGTGAALDTFLYRYGGNTLRTDGHFYAVGNVGVDYGGTGSKLYFGSALDTSLYRAAAANLETSGSFSARQSLLVDTENGGNAVYFGSALDTRLYKLAAGVIRCDNRLDADDVTINGVSVRVAGPAPLALVNSWENRGGNNPLTAIRSGPIVTLDGVGRKASDSTSPGDTVGTVPVGFRPQNQVIGLGRTLGGVAELFLNPDGTLILNSYSGNPASSDGVGWLSLTGISYAYFGPATVEELPAPELPDAEPRDA